MSAIERLRARAARGSHLAPIPSEAVTRPRLLLLVAGLASAILALWTFYFRPWLGGKSILDPWLDRNRCAIAALCTPDFSLPSQPGVLAALVVIACFALALRGLDGVWMADDPATLPLTPSSQSRFTRYLWPTALVGFVAIAYQAYRVLSNMPASLPTWLVGMGALLLAAILWDAARHQDQACTIADLTVAVGITLILLGVACLMAGRVAAAPLLVTGGAALAGGSWWTVRVGSSIRPVEHVAMLVLSLVALVLAMSRAWSWHFAFIGDEWAFWWIARDINHQPQAFQLLSRRGPDDPYNYVSFGFQALMIHLAGENVFGWRLASVLPFAVSVPPVYVLTRWLAGRGAALLAAGLLASSHVLLSFSMVPHNITQALFPLTFGLGFFTFASRRASVLRYLLAGMATGVAVFVFGLGLLAVIPVGLLLLIFAWPLRRGVLPGWVPAVAGGLAVSMPLLVNLSWWQAMLLPTPVHSEVADRVSIGTQVARNVITGALLFLSSHRNTHYIAGPHADPVTALLTLVGLGYVLGGLVAHKRARAWLLSGSLFVVAVAGIQQYGYVSNTRVFILPVVYTVFAGLGGAALARLLLPKQTIARGALLGVLMVAGFGLNQLHLQQISLRNCCWAVEAHTIQQLQATEAPDRGGMPVFTISNRGSPPIDATIARAYDVGRERLVFLTLTEAAELPHFCSAGKQPAMALIDVRGGQVDAMRKRVAACWPGYEEDVVRSPAGDVIYYRFLTARGVEELARPVAQRQSQRQKPDSLAVVEPGDVVIDSSGVTYVLSPTEERIYRFASDGRSLGKLALEQRSPSAMALTPEGLLLVASAGSGSKLVWYDGAGRVIRRARPDLPVGVPRGLAVGASGEILAADVLAGRVVRLSPAGEVVGQFTAGGRIKRSASVALGPDGSIWVLDPDGQLLHLSPHDEVLATLSVPKASPERAWRVLVASNGDVIMTEPEAQRVVRRDVQGRLVRVWNGFDRPLGLGADASGRLFVSDLALDVVGILPLVDR